MRRSRFLSSTSALLLLGGCPGDDTVCEPGPGDGPADGLTVSAEGTTITYASLASGANNDCPFVGSPEGVISVTIGGAQSSPAGVGVISFCLPQPDLLVGGGEFPLDADNHPAREDDRVHVIDVEATISADCRWVHDPEDPPDGTATFTGFCANGTDPAGFGLTLEGWVPVTERCTGLPDRELDVRLEGTVAVQAEQL